MFNSDRFRKFIATGEIPVATALDAAIAEWEESKHPRGQAENKGQFKSKPETGDKFDRLDGDSDTAHLDAEYMDAVEKGDEQKCFELVKQRAKQAGYATQVFHGTPNGDFNTFKYLPTYVSENKEYADRYQSTSASSIRFGKTASKPMTKSLFLNTKKMFDTRKAPARRRFYNDYINGGEDWTPCSGLNTRLSDRGLPDWTEGEAMADYIRAKNLPYEGIIIDERGYVGMDGKVHDRGLSYAILKPSKVKSADPITYDDNGNPIPLSKRFDSTNPDIRY